LTFDVYYLTNDIDLFGFNTYFYAYFSGILLVGVTRKNEYYDGIYGCPLDFLDHDFSHNLDIVGRDTHMNSHYVESFYLLKKSYNRILNEIEDKELKEIVLLGIWMCIHELNILTVQNSITDPRVYIHSVATFGENPTINVFNNIFGTYSQTLESQEIVEEVNDFLSKYDEEDFEYGNHYYYYAIMFYAYLRIIEQ